MNRTLLSACLVLCLACVANATTFYVSQMVGSDDGNNGTSWAQAWLTLDNVNDAAKVLPGDTVFFGTGIWRGHYLNASSESYTLRLIGGSVGHPTVYADSAFVSGWPAKIYASDSISGWTLYSGNVWQATVAAHDYGVVGYGDSVLLKVTAIPTAEGYFYISGTTLYVWMQGNLDPRDYDMEASHHNTIIPYSKQSSNVTLYGLEFRYGTGSNIYTHQSGSNADNVTISHCRLVGVVGASGSNPSAIQIAVCIDTANLGHNWLIRGCEFVTGRTSAGFAANGQGLSSGHGSAITAYGVKNLVVESCLFKGAYTGCAIELKNQVVGCQVDSVVIRYNRIEGFVGQYGVEGSWNHHHDVWVYGNIIRQVPGNKVWNSMGSSTGSTPPGENIYFFNNTVYNATRFFVIGGDEGNYPALNKQVMYNIFYTNTGYSGTTIVDVDVDDVTAGATIYDSNLYYVPPGDTVFNISGGAGEINLTQWRALGFDVNTTLGVDPAFDSVSAVDPWKGFARSAASAEMNRTYGNETWTVYGAVQAATPCGVSHSLSSASVSQTSAIAIDNFDRDTDSTIAKLKLVWDDDSSIADPLGADSILTVSITDPDSLAIAGLTAGTQYWYWWILYNGGCDPDTSIAGTFTTAAGVPHLMIRK